MRSSAGLRSTSACSSGSGSTATVQALVWMRPCASVAGTRCTRWPPDSNFKRVVDAVALDAQHHLLVAAQVGRALAHHLATPTLAFAVAQVHARQVGREQRRFLAARAGANLDERVALVVGIAWQQGGLQLRLQALDIALARQTAPPRQLDHLGVRKQLARLLRSRSRCCSVRYSADHRRRLRLFACHGAIARHVAASAGRPASRRVPAVAGPGVRVVGAGSVSSDG